MGGFDHRKGGLGREIAIFRAQKIVRMLIARLDHDNNSKGQNDANHLQPYIKTFASLNHCRLYTDSVQGCI